MLLIFLCFLYGSNLLSSIIPTSNPLIKFVNAGVLQKYSHHFPKRWNELGPKVSDSDKQNSDIYFRLNDTVFGRKGLKNDNRTYENTKTSNLTILYFAYGSNLLSSRIRINNPSAIFVNAGIIQDYRLDFNGFSNRWNGSGATIVPDFKENVWGIVWNISVQNIADLDKQEGVDSGFYFPLNVTVFGPKGLKSLCRTYQYTKPVKEKVDLSELPEKRQPSLTYMQVIIKGAEEHHLPKKYIKKLRSVKNNGNVVDDFSGPI